MAGSLFWLLQASDGRYIFCHGVGFLWWYLSKDTRCVSETERLLGNSAIAHDCRWIFCRLKWEIRPWVGTEDATKYRQKRNNRRAGPGEGLLRECGGNRSRAKKQRKRASQGSRYLWWSCSLAVYGSISIYIYQHAEYTTGWFHGQRRWWWRFLQY